ncbi:hypothetical protein MN205_12060 [Kineococcus sp. TRM81007]|uniref:hypothetical protein n=1 Tax=Kineococcus sp. TRM81007 TaxID=2925831 RepID=UPI001F5AF2A5|nr:hypothetical protein [Kineococcus sp. TRM81007]MCI2239221.1 hypothetical protein [Kineococcus sp. TRM81007]
MDDCWHTFSPHDRRRAAAADGARPDAQVLSPCLDCGCVVDLLTPLPSPQGTALFDLAEPPR